MVSLYVCLILRNVLLSFIELIMTLVVEHGEIF